MRIGIIDADLLSRHRHRFPNLACMKISGYYKNQGEQARLLLDYKEVENYDKVFVSKVFTDTYVPEEVLRSNNIVYGGTGFYYDKAPPLPENVEHSMPHLRLL